MGVPYVPFVLGTGACLILAMYINLYFLLAVPAVVFGMRLMARHDEHIFHLLGLHFSLRFRIRNVKLHGGIWQFSPHAARCENRRTP